MRRWMKNCIIIASLLLVSCTSPTLFSYSPSADLDLDSVTNTSTRVEVQTALGDVVEILDAPHLSITEQRARSAAVKVRSLLSPGHGSGARCPTPSRLESASGRTRPPTIQR